MKHKFSHIYDFIFAGLLLLSLVGCDRGSSGTITKAQEALIRKPVGQTPMPAEAMQAMQKGQREAAQKARSATGSTQ